MNWRSSIAPIARVTASISALTKFSVTGVPDFSAGLGPAAGRSAGVCAPSGGASATTATAVATSRKPRVWWGCFMLIRSR